MPRKAPDKVIEHRISLSNFERDKLIEELTKNRENALYQAGVNQIGAIAGSSVLLYGLLVYFGIDLFGKTKDALTSFVDDTSTDLADWLSLTVFDGKILSTEQANAIRNSFDRLDEAIVYHRKREQANSQASSALIVQLRANEITLQEFKAQIDVLSAEADELDKLRNDILTVRQWVRTIRALKLDYPVWMTIENWQDLLTTAIATGAPYTPNSGNQAS